MSLLVPRCRVPQLFGFLAMLIGLSLGCAVQGEVALIADGEARAVIVAPPDRKSFEHGGVEAVQELVEHLRLISGVELQVVTSNDDVPQGMLPIRLGEMADVALDELMEPDDENSSAFVLRVEASGISIRGVSDEGTLFGIYELLEQLGVRWYLPGELGRVVPETDTVRLAIQETVQVPSIKSRRLSGWSATNTGWYIRQRFGGEGRPTGSHGMPGNPPRGNAGRQICVSGHHAPGAIEAVVGSMRRTLEQSPNHKYFNMGPADGGGYCQCEGCVALDGDSYDPLRDAPSMTDRYIWFFNRVLEELEDDYPDVHIVWYVYAAHFFPPAHETPNPRIVATFAPIDFDRNRSMLNPMSPDRHIFREVVEGWSKLKPNHMNYRGYYNNLACPQFPWTQVDRIRTEIPALYALGMDVMRVEVIRQSWASSPVTPYIAGRVMWDVDADVDALLADFYEKFYGPAAEPMREYFEALEAAFRDTPYFTGSTFMYFPIFTNERRDTFRGHIEEATSRAPRDGEGLYGERVWALAAGFERMELFLDMIAARNNHDFAVAHEKMEAYYQLNDLLADYILEDASDRRRRHALVNFMERSDTGGNYFNRFFRSAVVSGHHRTVEVGELVQSLPDEWDFLIDPTRIGEAAGFYRPGKIGGNWQPLKTTSLSWSDQGLHYYKGDAWYRTEVTIPDEFEGRRIYLWFGGVDNLAKVWVNGQLMGTSSEPAEGLPGAPGTFRPFDFHATHAVRFGEPNTIAVRITNDRLAELGTGGIISPVMFWSPNDPDWVPGQ